MSGWNSLYCWPCDECTAKNTRAVSNVFIYYYMSDTIMLSVCTYMESNILILNFTSPDLQCLKINECTNNYMQRIILCKNYNNQLDYSERWKNIANKLEQIELWSCPISTTSIAGSIQEYDHAKFTLCVISYKILKSVWHI